jgi:hypothetical protein
MKGRWKLVLLGGAAVAAVAAGGGAAYATGVIGGGSSPVIVGCAKNESGDLRVVQDASQCRPNEHVVAFQAPVPPTAPQFVTVDCGAGQTVSKAIGDANPTEPLTVTVKGTCNEAVAIGRDDVSLNANAPGDGITAPAGATSAISLNAAHRVNLSGLTLSGGQWGILASNGSQFSASKLHVTGASNTGIAADLGSTAQLFDTTVDGNQGGVATYAGGAISINGGTVSNSAQFGVSTDSGAIRMSGGVVVSHSGWNGIFAGHGGSIEANDTTVTTSGSSGVLAYNGGAIHLYGSGVLVAHNSGQGVSAAGGGAVQIQGAVQVTNNGQGGANAFNTGALEISGAVIQNNTGEGVYISLGSSATIDTTTISGNTGDGIGLADTSTAQFGYPNGNNTVTDNGGWGVSCAGPPAVAMINGSVGTVSGNAFGRVNCPGA